jgi:4-amino-4-deoxy-L-arabinose transferase-like glycosyltransferase
MGLQVKSARPPRERGIPAFFQRPVLRPFILLVLIVLAFVIGDSWGVRKLANPDEGRYSEISREMAESGDFVTPRLNDLKYFEKPPLQYWATALAFRWFGQSDFTARLYTTLCGLGCLCLIFFTARRLFDGETAAYALMALAGAPYFMTMAHVITLDTGLTFWLTLAICAYLVAQSVHTAHDVGARRRWMLIAWVGMAGAVLSKGLIGIVFPAAALGAYAVYKRDWRRLIDLEWLRGLVLFFALTAPWFVLVSWRNPEFAHFFFIHEHVERFLTTTHHREGPWWYFFPILFAGFMPWAIALIPAIGRAIVAHGPVMGSSKPFSPLLFVVFYALFIFAFFSKSGSKLPHYIMPLFPVLALVLGAYLQRTRPLLLAWMILPTIGLGIAAANFAWDYPASREDEVTRRLYEAFSPWLIGAMALIVGVTLAGTALLFRHRKWAGLVVVSMGCLIAVKLINRGYDEISPLKSAYALSQSIGPKLTPDTRLYTVRNYEQSLPFYLKRTLTMVDYVDEFELGQRQEPQKYIPNLALFRSAWEAPGPAIAIIAPGDIEELRKMGFMFELIHQDPVRLAILKKQKT